MIHVGQYERELKDELWDRLSDFVDNDIKKAIREGKGDTNFLVSTCYYPIFEDWMKFYQRSGGFKFRKVLTESEHTIWNIAWR